MLIAPDTTHHLMDVTARPPLVFTRGEGSWIWDHAGRRYLDFIQGWAVNALGHSPKVLRDALNAQAAQLISCSPAFFNAPSAALAARIAETSGLARVFFTSSGAEANEGAIKLARRYGTKHRGGAFEIITFENAFHGRTLATMSASGKPGWDRLFAPQVPGFPKARLNDLDSVRALVTGRTVAIMLEPIQGEAGVIAASDDFLRELRAFTAERGLLLIVDEVQTGIGRTGHLYGFEHAGIRPDIMTLAKGLGGGVPLGALVASEAAAVFDRGDQGGTYCGNPLMTAVGLAVFETVAQPAFLERVVAAGNRLRAGLQQLARTNRCTAVQGRGLLLALGLGREIGARVVEAARAEGLLINSPRPAWLRFMPALNVTDAEIDAALSIVDLALGKVSIA